MMLVLLPTLAAAQPFAIGSRSITFFDASRNRSIVTELRYPATSPGSDAPFAQGAFPVLVIGHGFVMGTDAYANLWNHFVPLGYIVALPTTEGGFAPSHSAFGLDLAFVAGAVQAANGDGASPLFTHVSPFTTLMGHSMGGGASFLGAAGNSAITTVVNLAAAETNPSAIAASAQVLVPTLVFAGSNDCITPIAEHQQPMYEALTVPCRAFVSITGGGHCYFADYNFNCAFGELTCSPSPSITRAQQHDVVDDFATLWLDHFLKGDADALNAFIDSAAVSDRAVCETTCALTTGMERTAIGATDIGVRLTGDQLVVHGNGPWRFELFDAAGRKAFVRAAVNGGEPVSISGLPDGAYVLRLQGAAGLSSTRVLIAR